MAESTNKSYEEIYELAINFYKENKKGVLEVTKLLGLSKQNGILKMKSYIMRQY